VLALLTGMALVAPTLAAAQAPLQKTDFNLHPGYAQTPWPAGHRDSANTDYVPIVMARDIRLAKHLLEGHPIFWAPIAGPEGHYYVTSGKGRGHSNLHAFDGRGNLIWKSKPQESLTDLDGFAIINAPVVAASGDVYVGDRDQLWAFRSDGRVKWVADLGPLGVDWGFMTVVLTAQGYVGGISTNGKVIFFRPENGALAMPPIDLPGGSGPPAEDTPPGSLWQDLMDPEIKPFLFNLIQGWEMEVANTPAVDPQSGRIYITSAGAEPGTGLLVGIDVKDDRLEIAFAAPMGGGSGTSPAVSHDGRHVYALDEAGHMVAVDAETGERLWQTAEGGGGSASPSVGPDGTIYTAGRDRLIGFRPDGTRVFEHRYDALCSEQIPTLTGFWSWIFSKPVAFVDSLFTVAEKEGWLNVVCGYHIELMPSRSARTRVPLPQKSLVVAIDLASGEPLGQPLAIPETSEGFITPTLDGSTFVTLSGAITSIFYQMLNPWLPERLKVPHEPRAGLLLLEPGSRLALARDGLRWLRALDANALGALAAGRPDEARALVRRGALQRAATHAVLQRAKQDGELAGASLEPALDELARAEAQYARVAAEPAPNAAALAQASALLAEVEASLPPRAGE
jgi:outer membrane protein assembly factor BamB